MNPVLASSLPILAVAVAAVAGSRHLVRTSRRRWAAVAGPPTAVVVLAGVLGVGWGISLAAGNRSAVQLAPLSGVRYQRIAFDQPRPMVFHLAVIDLDDGCVGFVTTTPGDDGVVPAETGTEFVDRTGAVLAVNVAYFYPIKEYPHWDAYPRSGDPITALGRVSVDGVTTGVPFVGWDHALVIDGDRAAVTTARAGVDLAIPGREVLVEGGEIVAPGSVPYPRTLVAVDRDADQLLWLVIDGKQPGYSEGATLAEASSWLVGQGADEVLELDGGGSATMAATIDGATRLLSRPSHQRVPGRQRPVATHLGVIDRCHE